MKKVFDIDYDFGEYSRKNMITNKTIYVYHNDKNVGIVSSIIYHRDPINNRMIYKAEVDLFELDDNLDTLDLFPIATIDKVNKKIDIKKFIFK